MNLTPPTKKNICAIVVTYFPDKEFSGRVEAIAHQVDRVVIVDNRSGDETLDQLSQLTQKFPIDLIANDQNLGVATALNLGVAKAREGGAQWVLLFDQDSIPDGDLVEQLIAIYSGCDDRDKIAVLGANFYHEITGVAYFSCDDDQQAFLERKSVITSGSLIPLSCIATIGGFVDGLFIDYVDHEFCFRARANGLRVLLSCKPLMKHSIGGVKPKKIPGVKSLPTQNAPVRYYYIVRNNIYMLKNFFLSDMGYMTRHQLFILACLLSILFVQSNKLENLKYYFKGLLHGLLNVPGPYR